MTWWRRSRSEPTEAVSVNEALSRLSSADLESVAEQSLMMAEEAMTRMRLAPKDASFYLERAGVNARQAADALEILHRRTFS